MSTEGRRRIPGRGDIRGGHGRFHGRPRRSGRARPALRGRARAETARPVRHRHRRHRPARRRGRGLGPAGAALRSGRPGGLGRGTSAWWPISGPRWSRKSRPIRCSARSAGAGCRRRWTRTYPGYAVPSGTVTRVITEGFGAKRDEIPLTGFELRASWSPAAPASSKGRRAARPAPGQDPGRRRPGEPGPVGTHLGLVRLPGRRGRAGTPGNTGAAAAGARVSSDSEVDGPGQEPVPLLEPRDGLPPVVATEAALAEVTDRLARGQGPVAVDAERASGYRYGQRAYLVQLRRAGAGTVLIDPIACPDLSGVDAALRTRRPSCTRRRRTCPAWPKWVSGHGSCSTPNWPGGCSATRGWRSARWSRRCSGSTWRRVTRPPTGRPARCGRRCCGMRHSTSRC